MADAGDRMFCHACGGVWLKDRHGLICPHCQSDFTEIIEIPPDTEDPYSHPSHASSSSPPRERTQSPVNPWADHNPWAHDEEDNVEYRPGNGFSHRTYRSPDGRFTFTSTTFGNGNGGFSMRRSPAQQRQAPTDPLIPMVRSLNTIFQGLAETYPQQDQPRGTSARVGMRGFDDLDEQQQRERDGESEFRSTGRLYPRDAEGPQPMAHPLGTLGDILELFRTDVGGTGAGGGVRVVAGPNPFAILSTLLNLDRHGDAVYSQEELDRVISQLVDQNMNGTAPPPAAHNAIESLPKKKIDEEMLGNEGKAECSICMDPVELGTEVTVLPCKHWFHYPCIEAWLNQHNTCPHCRRGIDTPTSTQPGGASDNPLVIPDSPEPPSPLRRRSRAGPDYSGQPSSTPLWSDSESHEQDHQRQSSQSEGGGAGGGGFTEWLRNRFGGS